MPERVAYASKHYTSADGRLTLFARVYPARDAGQNKTPLLMLHGLTRNSADFEPLIEMLSTDRQIIVPDQRGRGQSGYDPEPAHYRPDIYAADMWTLLDELAIERVICIGTSMGGLISMLMAAQQPKRVAGIALNDIGPEVSEAGLQRISGYVGSAEPMADWDEAAAHCARINGEAFDGYGSDDWMAFARRTCVETPGGQIAFAYDTQISHGMDEQDRSAVPPDLWELWGGIAETPILAIRGANSDILTAETLAIMAERHRGDFSGVEVPGRGHAPLLDEPVAVTAIEAFLDRLPG